MTNITPERIADIRKLKKLAAGGKLKFIPGTLDTNSHVAKYLLAILDDITGLLDALEAERVENARLREALDGCTDIIYRLQNNQPQQIGMNTVYAGTFNKFMVDQIANKAREALKGGEA